MSFFEAVHGCKKNVDLQYTIRDPKHTGRGPARKVQRSRTVTVDIPPGVDTGITLRMPGQGAEGTTGFPSGDLLIDLEVAQDPYFKRRDADVHVEVPVSISQAILGGTVDVLTLDGMVSMKIPPGTQPDDVLLLRGKGVRVVNSANRRGNQHVKVKVQIPKQVTPRQRQLIEEFDNPNAPAASATEGAKEQGTTSSATGSEKKNCNSSFTIEQAWKRVKDYWSSAKPSDSSDKGSSGKTEAKEGSAEKGKEDPENTAKAGV